jgi:hypothetical protein
MTRKPFWTVRSVVSGATGVLVAEYHCTDDNDDNHRKGDWWLCRNFWDFKTRTMMLFWVSACLAVHGCCSVLYLAIGSEGDLGEYRLRKRRIRGHVNYHEESILCLLHFYSG